MNITKYNKGIVAFVMALIMIANTWKPGLIPLDEATVNTIVGLLGSVAVVLIPNKKTDA
jgi:hypothetical protein